mmetsp:Transcript_13983/g.29562  ORF Transcript_13983/g.29562 Transcript_13983/m.29562 type:complete len:276 (+) Transcript_13983:879-1706(+)
MKGAFRAVAVVSLRLSFSSAVQPLLQRPPQPLVDRHDDHPVRDVGRDRDGKRAVQSPPSLSGGGGGASSVPPDDAGEGVPHAVVVTELHPLLDRVHGSHDGVVEERGDSSGQHGPGGGQGVSVSVSFAGRRRRAVRAELLDEFVAGEVEGVGGNAAHEHGLDSSPEALDSGGGGRRGSGRGALAPGSFLRDPFRRGRRRMDGIVGQSVHPPLMGRVVATVMWMVLEQGGIPAGSAGGGSSSSSSSASGGRSVVMMHEMLHGGPNSLRFQSRRPRR